MPTFNLVVYQNVIKKLTNQWDRVHGTGAAAIFGSWILQHYDTLEDLLNAEIEVSDRGRRIFKNFKNLKEAVSEVPWLDQFMCGMRGSENRIRFELD